MAKILFIPHGGGPLPLLDNPGYARLSIALRDLGPVLQSASAIIVVTAHWETDRPCLTTSPRPGMLYDYYGFPEQAYQITYSAPGAPTLARSVAEALAAAGLEAEFDDVRGFDHGTFVPMALMRPEADIPILQMSVLASLDPAQHIAMGAALAPLLQDDIVLIGSGFSFHNLKALQGRLGEQEAQRGQSLAKEFHDYLDRAVCAPELGIEDRNLMLMNWENAPGARFCQPREEHLLPLHVCYGAASQAGLSGTRIFGEPVKGFQTSGYLWR
jgi:aromatic ring-opening dioxygenase catalytic subunit (LigB family)